ncbi:NTP transferase domain-containing protein [Candidatus Woesearchaeota archaeon]|nr:NTP transferase domain-containing protein [Candidatus Woesearchaeota archaeon]
MKVIIPVAGMGTRMRPHTHSNPKPLMIVAGKPAINHILDSLEGLDISEVIIIAGGVIVGRQLDTLKKYIEGAYKYKFTFLEQDELKGPAHALAVAEKRIDEPVLIDFCDTLFETDMSVVKKLKDEAGIIWTKEVEDYKRFGICVLDKKGFLKEMVEKPEQPVGKLATIGLYFIKDYKLFFEAINYIFKNNLTVKGEYYLPDAFMYMINKGAKIICPEVDSWYDTGKPETLLESNKALLKKNHKAIKAENSTIIPPVHIADDVVIKDSVIGPFVSIAKGSKITSCIIKDSLIGEDSELSNLVLERSIIGREATVEAESSKLNIGDNSVISLKRKY